MRTLYFNILFLSSVQLFSQNDIVLKKENGDCRNAILISDTIFGPTSAPIDQGNIIEFSNNSSDDSLCIEQEHHVVWYKFYAKSNGELSFDIIPKSLQDDYDFMLFKYTDTAFCNNLVSKEVKPVRTNISRNDKKIRGTIGLSSKAKNDYIHSGLGASYSKSLYVRKNELYYLLVDNVYEKGSGHTIKFHYNTNSFIKGRELTFSNILFEPGTDEILPVSDKDLDKLYSVLKTNPNMKVEIQGHINHPFNKNELTSSKNVEYDQTLSEKRAKAVKDYLIKKGINESRLTSKGYGSSKMLYPNAKKEAEFMINRRVSVLILSN